jgi:hypothetical protein
MPNCFLTKEMTIGDKGLCPGKEVEEGIINRSTPPRPEYNLSLMFIQTPNLVALFYTHVRRDE